MFNRILFSFVALGIITSPLSSIGTSARTPEQAVRERQVKTVGSKSPTSGKASRSKPLTAKEHRQAEQRLADMGYWTGKVDGRWDTASRHALIAFQKVEKLRRTGRINRAVYEILMRAERPAPLEAGETHIEIDLVKQVLFYVEEDGTITRILPVSTGSGRLFRSQGVTREARTWPGRYKIRTKIPGWKKSPLGMMYYPSYFMWGTAIHGYQSVPTKPASHGCVRIPMFAARSFYRMATKGMDVVIHRNGITIPNAVVADDGDSEK